MLPIPTEMFSVDIKPQRGFFWNFRDVRKFLEPRFPLDSWVSMFFWIIVKILNSSLIGFASICVCMCAPTCVCLFAHMCVRTCAPTCVCLCDPMCALMCVCMCALMCLFFLFPWLFIWFADWTRTALTGFLALYPLRSLVLLPDVCWGHWFSYPMPAEVTGSPTRCPLRSLVLLPDARWGHWFWRHMGEYEDEQMGEQEDEHI